MTPEVEKKRRELFEAWLSTLPGLNNQRDEFGEYVYEPAFSYWVGFNAALDAVEIVLPEEFDKRDVQGLDYDEVVSAITATGLGLKVKP